MTEQPGSEHEADAPEDVKPGIEATMDQEPNTFEPEEDPAATETTET